jgi:hypothetical protein
MKEYLKYDILDSDNIKPMRKVAQEDRAELSIGKNTLVKKYSDDEILYEVLEMLDLSQTVSMKKIAEKLGIQPNEIQSRVDQPQYRHALFSKLQGILNITRLILIHNVSVEATENPSNVGLQKIMLSLLGFITERSAALNIQAEVDAQRGTLPETPQEKQQYIAEILIDTGFTENEYEKQYCMRLFDKYIQTIYRIRLENGDNIKTDSDALSSMTSTINIPPGVSAKTLIAKLEESISELKEMIGG